MVIILETSKTVSPSVRYLSNEGIIWTGAVIYVMTAKNSADATWVIPDE